jgi:hypothetical protein
VSSPDPYYETARLASDLQKLAGRIDLVPRHERNPRLEDPQILMLAARRLLQLQATINAMRTYGGAR